MGKILMMSPMRGNMDSGVGEFKEFDVMKMMNDFPTIEESLSRAIESVSVVDNGNEDFNIHKNYNESDNLDNVVKENSNNQNSSNDKPVEYKHNEETVKNKSFVNTICENVVDNMLKLIPTEINNGREVVVFDDEIIQEGIRNGN
nr:hypothetical protein [Tanacetum cinerariifolium]